MGKLMTENVTVVRYNDRLEEDARRRVKTGSSRYKNVKLSDTGMWTNQNLSFTRALGDMIKYAEAIIRGALVRNESRGSHYKPDFPETPTDSSAIKATLARYDAASDSCKIELASVDISLVAPRPRTYGKDTAKKEPAKPAVAAV